MPGLSVLSVTAVGLGVVCWLLHPSIGLLNHAVHLVARNSSQAVFSTTGISWAAALRSHAPILRDEWLRNKRQVPLFTELDSRQAAIDATGQWRTLWLRIYGVDLPALKNFPRLASALTAVPYRSAMFSRLAPNSYLSAHTGPTNLMWRYHLGLVVPPVGQDELLELRILEDETTHTLHWSNGTDLLIDDSFLHDVDNTTPHERVVLFLDVERDDIHWFARPLYKAALWALRFHPRAQKLVEMATKQQSHTFS